MRRKVLSVVLCVCMMMTMAPFAFATENTDAAASAATPVEYWTNFTQDTKTQSFASLDDALAYAQQQQDFYRRVVISGEYTLSHNITIPDNVYLDVLGTLNIPANITVTVPAAAKRLGVYSGGTVQGEGSVLVYGRGTSFSESKVSIMGSGVMDTGMIQVPEDHFLDNNGKNYFACNTPLYELTFADGTTRLTSDQSNVNSEITEVKLLDNIICNGWSLRGSAEGCVLDLNGYKLENSSTPTLSTCVIHIYTPFIVKNGTIQYNGNGYNTKGKTAGAVETSADVVIESDVTIDGGQSYGIWTEGYGHTLTVNGTVKSSTGAYAITGNGDNPGGSIADCNIIVNKGATITAPNGIGIYHPELGTVTINGGSISGNTGVQMCAGKLIVNGGYITSTGVNTDATGSQNAILDGGAVSIINRNYPGGIPSAEIKGGFLKASGTNALAVKAYDYKNNKVAAWENAAEHISITGGYFSTNPSAYCSNGLTGVPNTTSTAGEYPWTVGTEGAPGTNPADVVSSNLPASVPENAPNDVVEAAKEMDGANMTGEAIKAAVTTAANANNFNANSPVENVSGTTVLAKLKNLLDDTQTTVTESDVKIIYQTYVDVQLTDVVTTAAESNTKISELTVNLTPKYRVIATTNAIYNMYYNSLYVSGDPLSNDLGHSENAILVKDAQPLTLPEAEYEVSIQVPANFSLTKGQKVSIKHEKKPGVFEYYTGTVTYDTYNKYVTFTTNGFSPFTISAAAAFIGDTAYPTLQEAVDNVKDNETITLAQDVPTDAKITVAKTVSFTVDKNGHIFNKDQITAGANTTGTANESGNSIAYQFTYTRPSHSSSGSTTTSYNVNVTAATNGTVAADKKTAAKGATVTVTATPAKGYVVEAVKVVDKDGKDVAVTAKDGKYVFTMPGSAVTVTGSFKAETPAESGLPFVDVKNGDWFYDAVKYAYENGLMTGTSATTFAPNGTMNRAMIVTVLYRLEKSPAVTAAAKFTDVPAGQWYSDAVAWAAANGIVTGYDETTFGPMNPVTREQLAAILFRYEQYKGLENVTLEENLNRFPDQDKISAYAVPALQWAVGQKVINGNADGTLDPTGTATRAQVAQILMNLLQ